MPTPSRPDAAGAPAQAVELLPCPFCGAEAKLENYVVEAAVICTNYRVCRAKIIMQHAPREDTGIPAAIAAWNRRAAPPHRRRDEGAVTEAVDLREAAQEALELLSQLDPQHGITQQLRDALSAPSQVTEAMVDAACLAIDKENRLGSVDEAKADGGWVHRGYMRAALEAAERARVKG